MILSFVLNTVDGTFFPQQEKPAPTQFSFINFEANRVQGETSDIGIATSDTARLLLLIAIAPLLLITYFAELPWPSIQSLISTVVDNMTKP